MCTANKLPLFNSYYQLLFYSDDQEINNHFDVAMFLQEPLEAAQLQSNEQKGIYTMFKFCNLNMNNHSLDPQTFNQRNTKTTSITMFTYFFYRKYYKWKN